MKRPSANALLATGWLYYVCPMENVSAVATGNTSIHEQRLLKKPVLTNPQSKQAYSQMAQM